MEYLNALINNFYYFQNWYHAGGEGPQALWLYGGAACFLIFLMAAYRVGRKLLGHHKYRRTWYNEREFQTLLKITEEDQRSGHRVLSADEIRLLRVWQTGKAKGFGNDTGWRF
jgi:hypothetical protein